MIVLKCCSKNTWNAWTHQRMVCTNRQTGQDINWIISTTDIFKIFNNHMKIVYLSTTTTNCGWSNIKRQNIQIQWNYGKISSLLVCWQNINLMSVIITVSIFLPLSWGTDLLHRCHAMFLPLSRYKVSLSPLLKQQ